LLDNDQTFNAILVNFKIKQIKNKKKKCFFSYKKEILKKKSKNKEKKIKYLKKKTNDLIY
jgi:hypothetical protein